MSILMEEEIFFNTSHQSEAPEESGDRESFSIDQETLTKIVVRNSFTTLHQSGGIHGIAASLETNLYTGISGHEMDLRRRRQVFGSNLTLEDTYSLPLTNNLINFSQLIIYSIKDSTVILLLCCATLSVVLGIKRNGFEDGILDGVLVFAVISSVVCISTVIKFVTNRMNEKLICTRRRAAVKVMRDGKAQQVAVSEVVVGDVVCLEAGDQVPADGLFIHGETLKLDDDNHHDLLIHDCSHYYYKFRSMFTGAIVVGGDCRMLVTSVGEHSETSKMMKSFKGRTESKLQIAVDKMNSRLEKICLSLSLLVLVVQVVRCFGWETLCSDHDPDPKGVKTTVQDLMGEATKIIRRHGASHNRYVEMLSMLVFVTRDCLPLGLLVSLAYASKKSSRYYRAIARNLHVCGSLGLVTTICTGKTSDLFLDHAKMAEIWIGTDIFVGSTAGVKVDVLNALREAIGTAATAYVSAADDALVLWAKKFLGVDREKMKQSCTIEASDISTNRAGLLLKWNGDGNHSANVHWRGSPELILSMCTDYFDRHGTLQTLDENKRDVFNCFIEDIAADDSLQCVAFACKQVGQNGEEEIIELSDCGLTWLGLVRLKSPYNPEVKQAIEDCGESGVKIMLILEDDDIDTARLIAINSGILKPDEDTHEAVIEASVFRNCSDETRSRIIHNIRVMANASPLDKLLMVQCIKQIKGEVVAVTGMCTRDAPSLKEADVGVLASERSAQVAKENSDIVIMDQKFETIVASLKWGRCVYNNIRKFIQLHVTVIVSAFTINLAATLFFGEVPLQPFQLLWVNLIMDVFGALSLSAPISPQLRAHAAASPLTTNTMWRNIIFQVLYQVSVILVAQFKGKEYLYANQTDLKAIIFNSFVLCQVFVLVNAREIDKPNIFEGKRLYQNIWFLVSLGFLFILEVAIIETVTIVTHGRRLNLKHWSVCFGIAAMSLPIGLVAKWISLPW